MGSAKKYQRFFPQRGSKSTATEPIKEAGARKKQENVEDKRHVEALVKKIQQTLTNDQEKCKKAALIIEQLINQKPK